MLSATATWDPPKVIDGGFEEIKVAGPGAEPGDFALVSHTGFAQSMYAPVMFLTATVTAKDEVTVALNNYSGVEVNVGGGLVHVAVLKPSA